MRIPEEVILLFPKVQPLRKEQKQQNYIGKKEKVENSTKHRVN
jgi:hypothetical protein